MAYTFSWIVSTPYVLSSWGILPSGNFEGGNGLAFLLFAVKAYAGPTLAAIIMTSVTEGREGLRRLRHRLTQWRTRWQWYLFILVGIPADLVRYDQPTRGACDLSRSHTRNSTELSSRFFSIFFQTGLPEEIGWRGFAAPNATTLWAFMGHSAP
ncbi:MAG: hypothetical protein ABSB81_11585 [Halobacteriota archaeon]|jgi:hypothetical protein